MGSKPRILFLALAPRSDKRFCAQLALSTYDYCVQLFMLSMATLPLASNSVLKPISCNATQVSPQAHL